jgi:1,4-alpha-glucan branching enzyme
MKHKIDLTDFDLYLLGEGNHFESYEKLGAKVKTIGGVSGVQFAVWAPNADRVSVTGDFNGWDAEANILDNVRLSGVWAGFIPGLKEGDLYKYAIRGRHQKHIFYKTDPYAYCTELRPKTAAVVYDIDKYAWGDKIWMDKRKKWNFLSSPVSIYEVHLGSWKKDFDNKDFPNLWGYKNYRQYAYELVKWVKENGYTHIELLPVMEHPLDASWGYQVVNYYAPTARYGKPDDMMFLIDYCHQNNIGVILDWVPAHFPTDDYGLANFDSSQLYSYENPKKGFHQEWGTYVFDYGRYEVKNFLISNALFWLDKYHADGLRVDAVASMLYLDYSRNEGEWEPNIYGGRENLEAIAFIKKLNEITHERHPGILMIAEESTAFTGVSHPVYLGGLGFDMKWNMGWMNDILTYFSKEPVHRKFHQNQITFSLWYAFNENFILPISHDEVVHGKRSLIEKMPGDTWQKFANLRTFFGFMFGHPGKKLNFMGNDIAQYSEWNSDSQTDWYLLENEMNEKLNKFFSDIQRLYTSERAMYELDFYSLGFQWVDFSDADNSIVSFIRRSRDEKEILLFTFNFTPVPRYNYQLGVPYKGYYKEILNSDAEIYGGGGIGNGGGVQSVEQTRFLCKDSVFVTLPPLAVNIFKLERT